MSPDPMQPSQEAGDETPHFLESKPLQAKKKTPVPKQQVILLLLLVALFVFVSIQTFSGGKKKPIGKSMKTAVQAVEVIHEAAVTAENDAFLAAGSDDGERTSPFMKEAGAAEAVVAKTQKLILQGVLSDAKGSAYAVINEKIVKKGERMADKVVTSIRSDSVTLLADDGEEETLRMKT